MVKYRLFLHSLFFLITPIVLLGQSPSNSTGWTLVFEDQFNEPGLPDEEKWHIKDHGGRWWEWWNPDNVTIMQGDLILTADQDVCPYVSQGWWDIPCHYDFEGVTYPRIYSSGEINSAVAGGNPTEINFKYGYFEARIKIPDAIGDFPAFWLSYTEHTPEEQDSQWPPEIDILEYWKPASNPEEHRPHGNLHEMDCDESRSHRKEGYSLDYGDDCFPESPAEQYHIYGLEWNEHEIKWFIDDCLVGQTTNEDIPHDFLKLVISLQLWQVPEDGLDLDNQYMAVDWVRVWKPNDALYEEDYNKWPIQWHNGGYDTSGSFDEDGEVDKLGSWPINTSDKNTVGDFNGDGLDDILMASYHNAEIGILNYSEQESSWKSYWLNEGFEDFLGFPVSNSSQFLAGNFDADIQNELLFISEDNVAIVQFQEDEWIIV
ncbi:MAG: glycoside hydrolase family 16 protein, partial [Bacteroidota bacterium]